MTIIESLFYKVSLKFSKLSIGFSPQDVFSPNHRPRWTPLTVGCGYTRCG